MENLKMIFIGAIFLIAGYVFTIEKQEIDSNDHPEETKTTIVADEEQEKK